MRGLFIGLAPAIPGRLNDLQGTSYRLTDLTIALMGSMLFFSFSDNLMQLIDDLL